VFTLTALGPKEAEMRIIGVDLHTRQQTIAMLDTTTGELVEKTLEHDGDEVRKFYSALPSQVLVGVEASGSMHWFLELLEELGIGHQVGHPAEIRKAETRKQKHNRREAALLLRDDPARFADVTSGMQCGWNRSVFGFTGTREDRHKKGRAC
jgi:hypothetical protein